jgi:hypothetical protein
MYLYFMQRGGGRLDKIVKICQQEYDATLILYGENPSVVNPIRTFHASLAKSASKSSRFFYASLCAPSLGCSHAHLPYDTSCVKRSSMR